jgi:hypothetical protein
MMNKTLLVALCGIYFLVTGCETLYKPIAVHSPMLTNKGEGHATGTLGLFGTGLANVQAAYAVSDHIGIMTDGMFHYRTSNYSNDYESGKEVLHVNYGSAGLGYFEKFGGNQKQVVQIYSGAGYGNSKASIETSLSPTPEVSADFFNVYMQPGVVFTGKYLDMGIDIRMNYVKLYNVNGYLYNEFDWWNTDYEYTSNYTQEFVLFEPNFTLSTGSKHLKGILQTGFTIPILNAEGYFESNSGVFFLEPIIKLNIGVSYAFGRK